MVDSHVSHVTVEPGLAALYPECFPSDRLKAAVTWELCVFHSSVGCLLAFDVNTYEHSLVLVFFFFFKWPGALGRTFPWLGPWSVELSETHKPLLCQLCRSCIFYVFSVTCELVVGQEQKKFTSAKEKSHNLWSWESEASVCSAYKIYFGKLKQVHWKNTLCVLVYLCYHFTQIHIRTYCYKWCI